MEEVRRIPLDLIDLPETEARAEITREGLDELKESLSRQGLINPITVKPKGERFEIVAGVRRYLAAKELGWKEIPAIVRELDDFSTIEVMVHENIKREELSEIDQAQLIHILREREGLSYAKIAEMWGCSETKVRDLHKLVNADPEIKDALRAGLIKYSHALRIMKHPDRERRLWFLKYTIEQGASPQTLEVMIRDDMGMYETIKDLVPVQKLTDAKPHLREVYGRCAFCDNKVIVDQLMVIYLCFDCYNAFMEMRRSGQWAATLRGTSENSQPSEY